MCVKIGFLGFQPTQNSWLILTPNFAYFKFNYTQKRCFLSNSRFPMQQIKLTQQAPGVSSRTVAKDAELYNTNSVSRKRSKVKDDTKTTGSGDKKQKTTAKKKPCIWP